MDELNLFYHRLFVYGPVIVYLVIGIVVHLTYGKKPKSGGRKGPP